MFRFLSLALTALLYVGCTTDIVPATGEKRFLGYTWQQEAEIGKKSSKEIAALFGLYRDPQLERYVTEVGNRVLATSHLRRAGTEEQFRNTPVTFTILDSPIINAMALPGGYIYITRGMLAHLNDEDQLAAVLAHEIGHVAAARGAPGVAATNRSRTPARRRPARPGSARAPAQDLMNLGGMATQLLFLRYSRDDELEADKLSVEYSSSPAMTRGT